ncbi:Hypothetical predicted protein [Drosophila guanche]|uniref:Uncharacterized protein n=1 Tax=Drosophila guanche TaxID=7266 RepID=A0A3B0K5X3_DROGU|nr:Hypothetical predicted protein [Drosophila guanche]
MARAGTIGTNAQAADSKRGTTGPTVQATSLVPGTATRTSADAPTTDVGARGAPMDTARAQGLARVRGPRTGRTNRLVTERGVRYRVTMSAAGTAVFRDQHSGRAE